MHGPIPARIRSVRAPSAVIAATVASMTPASACTASSPTQTCISAIKEARSKLKRGRQRRLCCATFHKAALAPCAERRAQFRGATTEAIGVILDGANSMVALAAIHSRKKVRGSRWLKSRGGVGSESRDRIGVK